MVLEQMMVVVQRIEEARGRTCDGIFIHSSPPMRATTRSLEVPPGSRRELSSLSPSSTCFCETLADWILPWPPRVWLRYRTSPAGCGWPPSRPSEILTCILNHSFPPPHTARRNPIQQNKQALLLVPMCAQYLLHQYNQSLSHSLTHTHTYTHTRQGVAGSYSYPTPSSWHYLSAAQASTVSEVDPVDQLRIVGVMSTT